MRDMQDEAGAPLTAANDQSPPTTDSRQHRRRLFLLLGAVAVVVYVADQLTKAWALNALVPGEPIGVVADLIRLNLIRNAGAAFSIGNGNTWVMTLIAFGVLVFILRTASRPHRIDPVTLTAINFSSAFAETASTRANPPVVDRTPSLRE